MKKVIILVAVIVVVVIGASSYAMYQVNISKKGAEKSCTQEAKICPDGSAVGRSGPNCEFAVCPTENSASPVTISEAEAKDIAEKTCIKGGESLTSGYYNENSKTWWFDANLNATQKGCNPACVVSEETRTAEINWRCTGLVPITDGNIDCLPSQRNKLCTQEFDPVCATVNVQCVKAPCNPVRQTFSNGCMACSNSLVSSYI
ncbi:MAG: hypothetical protein WC817_03860 [Patescibacteria group bacterium]|jgi:hypothetical protein